ncbi:MAG TPA: hypothetical protein VKI43_04315 [Vicinamibacterales bacterium]|nr:hypothetical protein [Vicinamibacterales bacterium]
MKLIRATFCLAAMCAAGLGAQSATTESKTKTKIEVKDGKEITATGCLRSNPGGGYMLMNAKGEQEYALVTNDDLSKHVGHRMEIKGKAADRGDGKVKIESTGTSGQDKTTVKTELKGDKADMNYLGVKSVKMLSASCM